MKRITETTWEKNDIMSVSYASLVTDNVDRNIKIEMRKTYF